MGRSAVRADEFDRTDSSRPSRPEVHCALADVLYFVLLCKDALCCLFFHACGTKEEIMTRAALHQTSPHAPEPCKAATNASSCSFDMADTPHGTGTDDKKYSPPPGSAATIDRPTGDVLQAARGSLTEPLLGLPIGESLYVPLKGKINQRYLDAKYCSPIILSPHVWTQSK